jgi:hypothetical protein
VTANSLIGSHAAPPALRMSRDARFAGIIEVDGRQWNN